MTAAGNSDAAPLDPQHGSSGGGGPVFPDPVIRQASVESERPEFGTAGAESEPENRTDRSDVEHPGWCDTPNCHVRMGAGSPFGSHRSKVVTLPGRIEVRLSIWALHGTPAAIAFDIIDEQLAEGLRDVEVPAFVAEVPLTLGELVREAGVLLDIEDARTAARVMLELARQAEAS